MSDAPTGPTVFNDRYELHRLIARGGMADVYLARDLLLDRPVAVKVLFPEYAKDTTFVERFKREARAAANLNHPNVVAVYDWGQQIGTYFIVMEYVEGRSLSEIIRSEGPLHPNRSAEITADVAAALSFAHRNGVVHRDIKPGNILITSQGQVKVADFGIAQALSSETTQANLTQAGAVIGTATYFSPEQAQGKPVDPRSDLYSLGCVLYEMLTTRPPFSGDSPVAIAYKHVQETPQPPSEINSNIPRSLEAITLKLLAKDPINRYPSAEDLRTDLRAFLDGKPVGALGAAAVGAMVGAAGGAAGVAAAEATQAIPATAVAGAPVVGPPTGVEPAYQGPLEEPPRKRSGAFIALLILLLLLLAGVLVILGLQLSRDTTAQVTVPDVTSLNVDEAQRRLVAEGFEVDVRVQENNEFPPGIVFDQSPRGGTNADEGSTVILRVSAGLGEAQVPNVVGRSESAARSLLENAGFEVVADEQSSGDVPAGQVISQDPAAGTTQQRGSVVTILVSTGPEQVRVPNVTGQRADDAEVALRDAGFNVNRRSVTDESVPDGDVVRTEPAAGSEQPRGSSVTLIVSSGPPETTTTTTTTTTTAPPPTPTTPTTASANGANNFTGNAND
jgi:eukaryotic-like serine/threonine-protein kinase